MRTVLCHGSLWRIQGTWGASKSGGGASLN
jgi:hypothetical protein